MSISIFQGNTSPSLSDTITVDGVAFDLTGSTVKLRMRQEDAPSSDPLKIDAAAAVVTAAEGTVRYDWTAGDVDTAGDFIAWWHVQLPTGKVQETDEFAVEILGHGSSSTSGLLVEVSEVRMAMGLGRTDSSQDDQIRRLIPVVSREIHQWTQREFTPIADATRRFRVNSRLVDLAPYDLRTATTITFDPVGGPAVLSATDYRLQPVNSPDGVYTYLKISDLFAVQTGTWVQFGFNEIDVHGAWGFATVPLDVREAAVIAIRSWLRRDTATYAQIDSDLRQVQPEVFGTYKLPPAAKAKLDPYKRMVV